MRQLEMGGGMAGPAAGGAEGGGGPDAEPVVTRTQIALLRQIAGFQDCSADGIRPIPPFQATHEGQIWVVGGANGALCMLRGRPEVPLPGSGLFDPTWWHAAMRRQTGEEISLAQLAGWARRGVWRAHGTSPGDGDFRASRAGHLGHLAGVPLCRSLLWAALAPALLAQEQAPHVAPVLRDGCGVSRLIAPAGQSDRVLFLGVRGLWRVTIAGVRVAPRQTRANTFAPEQLRRFAAGAWPVVRP